MLSLSLRYDEADCWLLHREAGGEGARQLGGPSQGRADVPLRQKETEGSQVEAKAKAKASERRGRTVKIETCVNREKS